MNPMQCPCGPRAGPAWESQMLFISNGIRTGPVRSPHGLFTGCLWSLNPYRTHKLMMHALKLYGPHMGRQNSYGAVRDPYGPCDWTYDFCSKQPGNNPYGARECDVTGALDNSFSTPLTLMSSLLMGGQHSPCSLVSTCVSLSVNTDANRLFRMFALSWLSDCRAPSSFSGVTPYPSLPWL